MLTNYTKSNKDTVDDDKNFKYEDPYINFSSNYFKLRFVILLIIFIDKKYKIIKTSFLNFKNFK